MKHYFYFPTGRLLWFDLAQQLSDGNIAQPSLWLGDPVHESAARDRFSDAEVVPFKAFAKTRSVPDAKYDGTYSGFWNSDAFFRTKDRAIKLMDRVDSRENFRTIDREVFFNRLVLWGLERLAKLKPDFLLFSEAPHAAPQYVLYELARFAGIPVFLFASWPLAPVLSLRSEIDGPFLASPEAGRDPDFRREVFDEIATYLQTFADPANYGFEPRYMKRQRLRDPDSDMIQTLRRVLRGPAGMLELVVRRKRIASKRRRALWRAMLRGVGKDLPQNYVYFPLHYEPERTTNPDGGDFHDQIRCLAHLRATIPADMQIVVKEHPSQFNSRMHGHLGRSPAFYAAIGQIGGVHLVSQDSSTARLILGAAFVATVTGTVALEAAILGTRAMVFGNCWFEGCPNVHRFDSAGDHLDFIETPVAPPAEIQRWLENTFTARGLPGCINPSNEKYFSRFYDDGSLRAKELAAVTQAVSNALK